MSTTLRLRILVPFDVFAEDDQVLSIVAETRGGSLGILPRRRDFVAALAPGVLSYTTEASGEVFVATDEGVLVKTGLDVLVSVRRAIGGRDLAMLRESVEREFLTLNEQEKSERLIMAKLETGFLQRLVSMQHD